MCSRQKNSKRNGPVLLFKTTCIFKHRSSLLLSVATDGHGFQHEKSFNAIPEKINYKLLCLVLPDEIIIV